MKHSTVLLICILLATPTLASLDDYPAPFVTDGVMNTKIVVGENAATSDVIGGIDIAASIVAEAQTDLALGKTGSLLSSQLGVLDVNAPELGSEPLIVVGGPCANSVAAKLLGYPQPCRKDFSPGKATIQYFPRHEAVLVAGFSAQETLAASYVLADPSGYDLAGNRMTVTVAEGGVLNIREVQ